MSKWDAAQIAFEIASAAEDSYHRAVWLPRYESAKSGGPLMPDAIDAEAERFTDVRLAAEDVLIATPAPDLPAVIWKIEFARERWADFEDWPETWWAAVMADLRRLAA
ncbi:hypothetical protein [Parapedomonas caeni]